MGANESNNKIREKEEKEKTEEKEEKKLCKSNLNLGTLKSDYFLRKICHYVMKPKTLRIIRYNK